MCLWLPSMQKEQLHVFCSFKPYNPIHLQLLSLNSTHNQILPRLSPVHLCSGAALGCSSPDAAPAIPKWVGLWRGPRGLDLFYPGMGIRSVRANPHVRKWACLEFVLLTEFSLEAVCQVIISGVIICLVNTWRFYMNQQTGSSYLCGISSLGNTRKTNFNTSMQTLRMPCHSQGSSSVDWLPKSKLSWKRFWDICKFELLYSWNSGNKKHCSSCWILNAKIGFGGENAY